MKIDKNKDYQIIVFANQEEGLNAQKILLDENIDFKHISNLAVVVPEEKCQNVCHLLFDKGIFISGHYKFLYRDYEEDFFKRVQNYQPSDTEKEFLKSITLCYVAPCIADETKIRLIAYFDRDISEILPYLNAVIKGATYNKEFPCLTYTKGHRIINLFNIKVAVAKANDIIDAWELLNDIKNLINDTYRNKNKIKPDYEKRNEITPLQIYGWLPKTNCGSCSETNCLAFAAKLLLGEQKLENCKPLFSEPKFSENKKIMKELFEFVKV